MSMWMRFGDIDLRPRGLAAEDPPGQRELCRGDDDDVGGRTGDRLPGDAAVKGNQTTTLA